MQETTTEDYAVTLSRFATQLSLDKLSPEAVEAAKANVFDTLACAAAGSSAAGISELHGLATQWGGAPQASILVFGDKVPAHQAAWVNGAMAHARDYDDTHDAAVLHAGVSVVPAALAAAELAGGVSGADFIAGVAAGLETICRIGVATQIGIIESGYMYTSLFGHFGATVAAGRVLGLNETQMINALGIDYSQVAGNHQVTRDAALTKRMQPGFAAMAALISVQMARVGIRGAQRTFEGEDGFLRVYLHDRCDRAVLRDGLGERFEFTQLSYKPYPCCRFNHPAISAALTLRKTIGQRVDRIRAIRVGLNHQAYQAVCTPVEVRKAPKTIVQAQFSIPYTVATALIDGRVGMDHFADASLVREDLLALAGKVDASVDAEIERQAGRNISPVMVEIEMDDGTIHRERVDVPLGHPDAPMSEDDFNGKAHDCMRASIRPLGDDAVARLRAQVNQLEKHKDARELIKALSPVT
ncbi:MAG: MmgE/PrpD family protein [Comamonadaceae bacterium]|nr:MmgE/PrpD family protein [Comamonadaceae bacterium]